MKKSVAWKDYYYQALQIFVIVFWSRLILFSNLFNFQIIVYLKKKQFLCSIQVTPTTLNRLPKVIPMLTAVFDEELMKLEDQLKRLRNSWVCHNGLLLYYCISNFDIVSDFKDSPQNSWLNIKWTWSLASKEKKMWSRKKERKRMYWGTYRHWQS